MTTELATSKQDLIGATILRNKLEAVVAEMEATLINTAYSATISTARHCATGLVTEHGQLIAISNPLHLYAITSSARAVIDRFQYDLSSEDVLLTNDPYGGGTQIQTFTLVAPFSLGDSISLYLVVSGRTEDFGETFAAGSIRPRPRSGQRVLAVRRCGWSRKEKSARICSRLSR